MTTIKLSTGDYRRDHGDIEQATRIALAAFRGIDAMAQDSGSPRHAVPLDAVAMIEGLYALSAMIIDTLVEVQTGDDRRAMAEEAGARILAYLLHFGDSYEASGKHAIEALGAVVGRKGTVQ